MWQQHLNYLILQVRIPDDQSSRSQFAIIDDELEEQLRAILESNETEDESKVFKMARDQYNACMDLDQVFRQKLLRLNATPICEIFWGGKIWRKLRIFSLKDSISGKKY